MSYISKHQRMKPVLDLARKLDIATNPHPRAIFEVGSGGFQVWCTPADHPTGWNGITMDRGAFSKPCAYVGSVHWKWEEETIVGLDIETSAFALADQKPDEYCNLTDIPASLQRRTIFNRDADIAWLKEKISWLFKEAAVSPLPFMYRQAPLSEIGAYTLTHYVAEADEYVVIVSPELDPDTFCKPGYKIAHTLEIWKAGDFPADILLRPDYDNLEIGRDPDPVPFVEHGENASQFDQDGWLEAMLEDTISGTEE